MPKMEVIDSGIGDELGKLVMSFGPASMAKNRAQALLMQSNIDLHSAQRRNVELDTDWEEETRRRRREADVAAGRALDLQQTSIGSALDAPGQARLNAAKAITGAGILTSSDVVRSGFEGLGRGQAYTYGLPPGEEARRALQTSMSGSIPRADYPLTDEQRRVIDREQQARDMEKARFQADAAAQAKFDEPVVTRPDTTTYISPRQAAARPDLAAAGNGPIPLGPDEIHRYRPQGSPPTGATPTVEPTPPAVTGTPSPGPSGPVGTVPGGGVGTTPPQSPSVAGSQGGQTAPGAVISTMGANSNFYSPGQQRSFYSRDGRTDLAGNPLPLDAIVSKDVDPTKLAALGAVDPKAVRQERQDFAGNKIAETYNTVVPIWNSIVKSSYIDDKAADLDVIFGIATILDPGSVVRNTDAQAVMATGPFSEYLNGLWSQVKGGAGLTPSIRANLLRMAENRVSGHVASYDALVQQYTGNAAANKYDIAQIIPQMPRPVRVELEKLNSAPALAVEKRPPVKEPPPAQATAGGPGGGAGSAQPGPTTGPVISPQGVPTTPQVIRRKTGNGWEHSIDDGRTYQPGWNP